LAVKIPEQDMIAPTDISIPPVMITKVIPAAVTAREAEYIPKFIKLFNLKKFGARIVKTITNTTRTPKRVISLNL
jgi:hypothetical protein